MTCDTKKMHILVLSTKTKICNLDKCGMGTYFYHTIMHHNSCGDFTVHISVLITKTNICRHHKHFLHDYLLTSVMVQNYIMTHLF
jgi:hypothetical protein